MTQTDDAAVHAISLKGNYGDTVRNQTFSRNQTFARNQTFSTWKAYVEPYNLFTIRPAVLCTVEVI